MSYSKLASEPITAPRLPASQFLTLATVTTFDKYFRALRSLKMLSMLETGQKNFEPVILQIALGNVVPKVKSTLEMFADMEMLGRGFVNIFILVKGTVNGTVPFAGMVQGTVMS